MLSSITILLVCQLLGEILARLAKLPVPGPVLGMVLLFLVLAVRGGVPDKLEVLTAGLLRHLSLLFVPAGVGVTVHLGLIAEEWLPIGASLVASTAITVAVTGLAASWLIRRRVGEGGAS